MSAEATDRQKSTAEGTLRLSAVEMVSGPTSIARYKILSELGQGAMARVYLALDPNIDRKVALKVLEPRGLVAEIDMDELRTRFLLEARAAGNLRHPSAVAIYDAAHDPESGYSFIAMEWIDGQSLDRLLKSSGPLPIDQAISITAQMAGALDAAHQQGLIHRDVKPGNILLDQDGNAKLSDFGIAKIDSLELTSTGQVLGTPYYMSPEQIRDDPLDGRSDLFSLGVVLYQCVTGELPFHATSLPALTHKILHVDPRPAVQVNRTVPDSVSSTIDKALQKEPGDRFPTGSELANALGARLEPITSTLSLSQASTSSTPLWADATDRHKRRKWWGIAGTLLLVVTLISLLAATWKGDLPAASEQAPTTETAIPEQITPPQAASDTTPVSVPDRQPTASPVLLTSRLQISFTNRLKNAQLDVWIDGEHVSTKHLTGAKGFLRRTWGTKIVETLSVSPGHHDVKLSIRGASGKIDASNWTGSLFVDGQTRRLRVELMPPKYLKLSWKDG